MTTVQSSSRADLVSAWGIGVGIGLISSQLTWLVGARLSGLIWEAPVGPTIALGFACLVGIVTAIITGRRLATKVGTDQPTV